MSCDICCEKFNKSTRKQISCLFCQKIACKQCFLSTINAKEDTLLKHCLFCGEAWDKTFICENFTQNQINEVFVNLQNQNAIERELSLLPQTQEYANLALQATKNENLIKKKIEQLRLLKAEMNILQEDINFLGNENSQINTTIYSLKTTNENDSGFKIKCPSENCNSFLDRNLKCERCEISFCKKCFQEEKDENHECNEDDIATYEEIKKNTKPCPACGERISKVNGCDQMWCIMCKKGFSWRTGKIEQGAIHNPEYFRWLRENENAEEQEDYRIPDAQNNCVFPDSRYYNRILGYLLSNKEEQHQKFLYIYRLGVEFETRIETLQYQNERSENELIRNRINYLNSKITKNGFENKINEIEAFVLKRQDLINIYNVVKTVILETCWVILEHYNNNTLLGLSKTRQMFDSQMERLEKIRGFANEAFKKISSKKIHGCKKYFIDNEWFLR